MPVKKGVHSAHDAAKARLDGKTPFFFPKKRAPIDAARTKGAKEAAALLMKNPDSSLERIKNSMCRKHGITYLKNSEILQFIPSANEAIRRLLLKSPTRTLSGVSPIAIMPPPYPCVGRCTYCPKGENAPQSYTGFEPTTMRAIQCGYSAKKQVEARLRQYSQQGHETDKCHLIFMGGTFLASPVPPRRKFVKEAFDTLNGFVSRTLEEAINNNERAKHRAIGATFETRPDFALKREADEMLALGGTQVEIGVQSLSDRVYQKVNRRHTLFEVERATRTLKDSGFKICYHMMPGLYSTPAQDADYFKRLFSTSRFQPDMVKIYPVLVLPGTKLYDEWKAGRFTPYSTEEAADAIADATKHIPPYVRIPRIQRDIPSPLVLAGVKNSNLRQIVGQKLREEGTVCSCIRCREVGSAARQSHAAKKLSLSLLRRDYFASGGKEIFLSFEDEKQDLLAGFLRLRIPSESHRAEISNGKSTVSLRSRGGTSLHESPDRNGAVFSSLVRELHIYGQEASIGEKSEGKFQHKGLGRKLLFEAERITKREYGLERISVLSGPGARGYYRKYGYSLEGPYMQKKV